MADLKNMTYESSGGDEIPIGVRYVPFITGANNQRDNQVPDRDSQGNFNLKSNNAALNGSPGLTASGLLTRKVPNQLGVNLGQPNKKRPTSLTHLPRRPPIDIEFKDLSYSVSEGHKKGRKTILKCVNGKFRSGELTAIMGPSGAGKSTLMNALAGYKASNLSGSVTINGKDRNLRRFRKMSCYIMQDDCLMPFLTVYEAMTVSANLKLGKDISAATKRVVVEEIIETMGLNEASHTQTINLSGGQKKRLSIALELVNNPPVMFFDEPTSGLDSASCFQCLSLLKSLSRGGRTIICTIHQPSARLFEMFDHLYLLADGQCIYQGNVGGLVPFLSSMGFDCPSYHNPADYVMEVASGEHGECTTELVTAVNNGECGNYQDYEATFAAAHALKNDITKKLSQTQEQTKSENVNLIANEDAKGSAGQAVINVQANCTTSLLESVESMDYQVGFPTSGWVQFWVLLKRTFLSQIRDMTLTRIRLISHIIVGLLIGAIYYQIGNDASVVSSNAGCIFFTVMFIMFTAMMPTILTFPVEMSVFVREHLNYWYSLKAFYLARTLCDIPFQILYSTAYVMIVYFLTAQPLETERFFMYLNVCVLTSLVSQSMGLLIGAAMSIETGTFIGPVTTVPFVLFSGFFVKFKAIPTCLKFLSYLSYTRYGFEGAIISIYGYNRPKLKCSEIYCHFKNPQKFLEEMSMVDAVYWIDVVALIIFLIGFRIAAYFVLRLRLQSLR